ncbi:MAG TPA: HAD-IA family hydrolase [Paracoccus sp. (in: a-proteobacteria)]|nr:HAD-IA family hydrolase [Paracoccus sp. (in: a-proteobacteria)]
MPEALIFDVDGTLAETEELHRRAFNHSFAAAGLDWHWDRGIYRRLLAVTGGKERIAHFIAHDLRRSPRDHDIAALHRDKTDRYAALMEAGEIALRDGIGALIEDARSHGLRLGIATTTSRPNIDALIRATLRAASEDLFDAIAAGDEVQAKKPAPDVYLLALHRLGMAAPGAVALEDSLNGLRAARAAGLRCIVSPATYTTHEVFPGDVPCIESFSMIASVADLRARLKNHAEAVP